MKLVSGSKLVVVLAGIAALGCEQAPLPTEATPEPTGALHSQTQAMSGETVWWDGNIVEAVVEGETFRWERDSNTATYIEIYRNDAHTHSLHIERNSSGQPTSLMIVDVMSMDWFKVTPDGETLLAYSFAGDDCDDPNCVDPLGGGGLALVPGPNGMPITVFGSCSAEKNAFKAGVTLSVGGLGMTGGGVIAALAFPPSAPVSGAVARFGLKTTGVGLAAAALSGLAWFYCARDAGGEPCDPDDGDPDCLPEVESVPEGGLAPVSLP